MGLNLQGMPGMWPRTPVLIEGKFVECCTYLYFSQPRSPKQNHCGWELASFFVSSLLIPTCRKFENQMYYMVDH